MHRRIKAGIAALGLVAAAGGAVPGLVGAASAGTCVPLAVTNNGQTVRNYNMPDIKYNLTNCGTATAAITVTVTEYPGFLSVLCPSPVAPPVTVTLAPNAKLSTTAPVFRGPCGYAGSSSTTLVSTPLGWQGHNLQLTATNAATGATLGTGFFSWQDAPTRP